MLASNALITVAQAKSYLGITDTTKDSVIETFVNGVSQTIEQYINKDLTLQTYTEKLNGNNRQIVSVNNYPIQDIIYINFFGYLLNPTDYECDERQKKRGWLYKETGWASQNYLTGIAGDPMAGQRIIEVQYTAGYALADIPSDIQLAAMKLVAMERKESSYGEDRLGIESESEGGVKYTYSKKETEMPLNISCVLDRYSKKRV